MLDFCPGMGGVLSRMPPGGCFGQVVRGIFENGRLMRVILAVNYRQ